MNYPQDSQVYYNGELDSGSLGSGNDSQDSDSHSATIAQVTSLIWETYPDDVTASPDHGANLTLTTCPKNGGKQIFPGKKDVNDTANETTMRQKVKVKATLNVTPSAGDNITVYFKAWDVDDPDASNYPIDPCDSHPDANEHSKDNHGTFGFNGSSSSISVLATSNVVDANFFASLRPGDNYRVTATTSPGHNDELNHHKVQTNSLPSTVKRTDMLTTWRKIHVDFDSMDAPPANEPFDTVTGTSVGITDDMLVALVDPNWPTNSLNGGVLDPNGTSPSASVNYVAELTFEVKVNTSNALAIYTDYNDDRFDNDSANGIDDAGEIFDMNSFYAFPSLKSFGINTDDKKWKTADLPEPSSATIISSMNGYYDDAYIKAEEQTVNPIDSFSWDRQTEIQLATPDFPGSSTYWTASVGWAYEEKDKQGYICSDNCPNHTSWDGDYDPDYEGEPGLCGATLGVADAIPGEKCMIYLENIRELGAVTAKTVSHEIGHLFGLKHAQWDPSPGFDPNQDGMMGWYDKEKTCEYDWFAIYDAHTNPNRFSYENVLHLRKDSFD
ncbi:MAG: hypothetical protein ACYSWP_14150 [Planctomycetota bacterium]|jgi:hypothetical protein